MQKSLSGPWPLIVVMLMFFVLPMATIPGLFDLIFVVLGGFTLVIVGLIVASLVAARRRVTDER
jgi:hypothetical protein